MKSDLISRTELFNRLADKHTKAEIYAVINDMPTEESLLEKGCEMMAKWWEAPCNYSLFGVDVSHIMPADWCDENCDTDAAMCWRKLFEVWEE